MFGVIRPSCPDNEVWREHMCGLCLGLRDGQGQLARATTNTDAIVLSLLTEAQTGRSTRRAAGPCALRGMWTASVATADSPGVELAATASLLLGAAKAMDWANDGDGRLRSRLSRRPSKKWHREALARGERIGLDVAPLWAAIMSQRAREFQGATLDEIIWPTEFCTAELYAHSAVLADRAENVAPLRTIGRSVGRIAHLTDAITDLESDRARGAFNPITATRTPLAVVYELLDRASEDVKTATSALNLANPEPVSTILVKGSRRAVAQADQADQAERPSLADGIVVMVCSYGSGYACGMEHTTPCSGKRKPPIFDRCCDRIGDCGNCCDCCSCCDC